MKKFNVFQDNNSMIRWNIVEAEDASQAMDIISDYPDKYCVTEITKEEWFERTGTEWEEVFCAEEVL